MGVHSILLYSN